MPPDLHYQTMKTEHLDIHYQDGYEDFATDLARTGEEALGLIEKTLDWKVSDRINVALVDNTDDANGSAQVTAYPLVNLFVTAPDDLSTLSEYADWPFELIAHELTHIVHLDTTHGLAWLVNKIFGRVYYPNQYQARWFIEGLAVEMETRLSEGGRMRSRQADMIFRQEFVEGKPMRLDQAVAGPLRYPQATTWYLHGGRFLTWVAATYGQDKLKDISHFYAKQPIPYAMNRAFKKIIGIGYDEAWAKFQAELKQQYETQLAAIAALGLREGRRLTEHGQYTYNPRFTPDGHILYFTETQSLIPQARLVDPASGEQTSVFNATTLAQASRPDASGHFFFSELEVAHSYYTFEDLFSGDLQGHYSRLTQGSRFRDPEVYGDSLYVVQNLGGNTQLVRLPLRDGEPVLKEASVVWEPPRHWQMYTPRVSPDGKTIAISVHRPPGQRDIALLDVATGRVTFVTDDLALDGGPCFSPDGAYLYFHSARTGVFNIFARRLSDGHEFQVTNVRSGALSPDVSADGKSLAYVGYTTLGYDIYLLPIDPENWLEASADISEREETFVPNKTATYPTVPYFPWHTLLPRSWLPFVGNDSLGSTIGLSVSGGDPLGRHTWAADIGFGVVSKDVDYDISYQNHQLYPYIDLEHSRQISTAPTGALIDGKNVLIVDRVNSFGLDVQVPFQTYTTGIALTAGYHYDHHERLSIISPRPDNLAPSLPPRGDFADLSLGLSIVHTRRTLGAISDEWGQTLGAQALIRDYWLGSAFKQYQLVAAAQQYFLMPWLKNHVFTARLQIAGGYDELTNQPLFSLGGFPIRDIARDLVFGAGVADYGLRGFGNGTVAGDAEYLVNLEYRAPLWRIEHGYSVLPFYLRTLSAAAFSDFGNADTMDNLFHRISAGVGGELRLDFDYGVFFGGEIRVGYARGLTRGGIDNFFLFLSNGF